MNAPAKIAAAPEGPAAGRRQPPIYAAHGVRDGFNLHLADHGGQP